MRCWLLVWLSVCSNVHDSHMIQLMPLPPHQTDLTFLVPAYPGCPGKEAVKGCVLGYQTVGLVT